MFIRYLQHLSRRIEIIELRFKHSSNSFQCIFYLLIKCYLLTYLCNVSYTAYHYWHTCFLLFWITYSVKEEIFLSLSIWVITECLFGLKWTWLIICQVAPRHKYLFFYIPDLLVSNVFLQVWRLSLSPKPLLNPFFSFFPMSIFPSSFLSSTGTVCSYIPTFQASLSCLILIFTGRTIIICHYKAFHSFSHHYHYHRHRHLRCHHHHHLGPITPPILLYLAFHPHWIVPLSLMCLVSSCLCILSLVFPFSRKALCHFFLGLESLLFLQILANYCCSIEAFLMPIPRQYLKAFLFFSYFHNNVNMCIF